MAWNNVTDTEILKMLHNSRKIMKIEMPMNKLQDDVIIGYTHINSR